MSSTEILIDKLTKAISYRYRDDKTGPGLTIAALKRGFYCSVVRYDGAFGAGKKVVVKAKDDSLQGALQKVAKQFLATVVMPIDPVQELGELVRRD